MTLPTETGNRGGQPRRGGGGAGAGGGADGELAASLAAQRQLARTVTLFIYVVWFGMLAAGSAAYAGEPIKVKGRDLPLAWFDALFRRFGALLLAALWAVRAAAALVAPQAAPAPARWLWTPAALYAGQATLRAGVYGLHYAGWLFPPSRSYAGPRSHHPPHVMSDHILLAATLVAGAACEAVLALLAWRHPSCPGGSATAATTAAASRSRASTGLGLLPATLCTAAVALSLLVSCESYFTARYFHPPGEILYAALLGLLLFQAPLLAYTRQAVAAQQEAAVETALGVALPAAEESEGAENAAAASGGSSGGRRGRRRSAAAAGSSG